MKIYFIRNTHDEHGDYRGDEYFGLIDMASFAKDFFKKYGGSSTPAIESEWDKAVEHNRIYQKKELPFGVHTWYGSGENYKLTFDQIYRRTQEMYIGGAADWTNEMPNDERHSVEGMLGSLSFMVKNKLVLVKLEDDGADSPKFELHYDTV